MAAADSSTFLTAGCCVFAAGYVRLLLLCVAAACGCGGAACLLWGLPLYMLSQGLDALDGYAARKYKQVSVFGACLDQLLDRLSTCLLYVLCAVAYPPYAVAFFCCLLADVGGHWLHFFAAAAAGAASHKQVDRSSSLVLHHYYTKKGEARCIASSISVC
ncbi:hypothetical protein Emed_005190 [Eimeria media]